MIPVDSLRLRKKQKQFSRSIAQGEANSLRCVNGISIQVISQDTTQKKSKSGIIQLILINNID